MNLRFKYLFTLVVVFSFSLTGRIDAQAPDVENMVTQLPKVNSKQRFILYEKIVNEYESQYNFLQAEKYANMALQEAIKSNLAKPISRALLKLGNIYEYQGKSTEALYCFNQLLKFSIQNCDSLGIGKAYSSIGYSYTNATRYDEALVYFKKAVPIFLQKGDKLNISVIYSNCASIYDQKADYLNAVKYFIESIKISSEIGDLPGVMIGLHNLASVFINLKNYDRALICLKKSLVLGEKLNDPAVIASCLSQLGMIYLIQKDFILADKYLQKGLTVCEDFPTAQGFMVTYIGLGRSAFQQNKIDDALMYFEKAYQILNENGLIATEVLLLLDIGEVYQKKREYNKAIKFYNECVQHSISNSAFDVLTACYLKMSEVYNQLGNTQQAYLYHKSYTQLKDSIYNIETANKINNVASKYEIDKKEAEIVLLEQEKLATNALYQKQQFKVWVWIIATICSIATGILFYICQRWRLRVSAVRKEIAEKEKQAKQVVNSVEAERKKISKDLHDSVGVLISASKHSVENLLFMNTNLEINEELNRVSKLLEKSVNEVRVISHQMSSNILSYFGLVSSIQDLLQQTLLANNIEFDFVHDDLAERPNTETELCIYRVVQEALSNIIKHSNATKVHLELTGRQHEIFLSIKDNGKGYDTIGSFTGLGLENMRTRVEVLKGNFSIHSDKNGTLILVKIPLESPI